MLRAEPFVLSVCWALCACDAYDPRLLASESTSGAGGSGGGTPSGAGSRKECGDGVLTAPEKCDTEIAANETGACPTSCLPGNPCETVKLQNAGTCMASCIVESKACVGGDGVCCSVSCDAGDEDPDCSGRCGDGILQEAEACEAGSSIPCPATLEDCDDNNPCNSDSLTGSAEACSAECVHAVVDEPLPDGNCCPPAENIDNSEDCTSTTCGNNTIEINEDCDDSSAECVACKLTTATPAQRACFDRLAQDGSQSPLCENCACSKCTAMTTFCRTDPTHKDLCSDVIDCALTQNCAGPDCYCIGAGCFIDPPNGRCYMPVQAAAGSTERITILARGMDSAYALNYAWDLSDCMVVNCPNVCPP